MPYIDTQARYENTTMREIRNTSGDLMGYDIAPIDEYVLHNTALDEYKYDPETNELTDELISHGFSPSSSSVEADYDFDLNPYEIYAVKREDVGNDGVIY